MAKRKLAIMQGVWGWIRQAGSSKASRRVRRQALAIMTPSMPTAGVAIMTAMMIMLPKLGIAVLLRMVVRVTMITTTMMVTNSTLTMATMITMATMTTMTKLTVQADTILIHIITLMIMARMVTIIMHTTATAIKTIMTAVKLVAGEELVAQVAQVAVMAAVVGTEVAFMVAAVRAAVVATAVAFMLVPQALVLGRVASMTIMAHRTRAPWR